MAQSLDDEGPPALIKVEDVMLSKIPLVESGTRIRKAAKVMKLRGCGCILVTHREKIAGIVTEQDLVHKILAEDLKPSLITVKQIMSRNVVGVEADAPVEAAVKLMKKHRVRHLPVARSDKLVGLVTLASLVEALAKKCEDIDLLHSLLKDLEQVKEPPRGLYA